MDQQTLSLGSRRSGDTPLSDAASEPNLVRLVLWSASILALAVVFALGLAGIAALVVAIVAGGEATSDLFVQLKFDPILRTRLGGAALSDLYVSLVMATLCVARLVARDTYLDRLAITPIKKGRGRTLTLAVATLLYATMVTTAINATQDHRLLDSGPTDIVLLAIFLANLCVLAPIAEELFFRGWLYTSLRGQMPFWPAYAIVTVLFAAIHWYASIAHMLKVLPLAAVLGLVREWKGSVKPTIALHAIYNATIVALTLASTS